VFLVLSDQQIFDGFVFFQAEKRDNHIQARSDTAKRAEHDKPEELPRPVGFLVKDPAAEHKHVGVKIPERGGHPWNGGEKVPFFEKIALEGSIDHDDRHKDEDRNEKQFQKCDHEHSLKGFAQLDDTNGV
jgi:hypothetical protein